MISLEDLRLKCSVYAKYMIQMQRAIEEMLTIELRYYENIV